ncbi:MAG: ABC transporter permease [Patescibacteria group bacterium]|nr:ABC transporter permease [Patescibacteria group bacterium]
MNISDLIAIASEALTLNKLRSFLATLGIIIGIASVIALLSLGEGSKQAIKLEVNSLGANLLTIIPGGTLQLPGSSTSLTLSDAKAIQNDSSIRRFVSNVSPEFSQDTNVASSRTYIGTTVLGVMPDYQFVHMVGMQQGAFLTQSDEKQLGKVAVIGPQVASSLFANANPIGQTVHINDTPFTVIGVTQSKGGNIAQYQDNLVYIPLSVAEYEVFGIHYLNAISVSVKNAKVMTEAQNALGYFLLARHHIINLTFADFSIISQKDVLHVASQTSQTLTSLLGGIAGISLVVGGIGIMNIMLMAVIERTREIGLRKALGATESEIIFQFLSETVILTFLGGISGMVIGVLTTTAISFFLQTLLVISLSGIILSLGVSCFMGIVFGLYPAYKAAALSPIEALRYE